MTNKINYLFQAGLTCLILSLTACGTTGSSASSTTGAAATSSPSAATSAVIEAALPLIRTGAAVATGAVLDFAVKQSGTRTRLANEMYAAANAVYSLSGGAFPAPAQFESSILTFGGSQTDASYAQFSTAIAGLYAAYYPKLVTGDAKTAGDLLNAIAGGIEDATASYVSTPAAVASVGDFDGVNGIGRTELTEFPEGKAGNEITPTCAFPSATWERGEAGILSF